MAQVTVNLKIHNRSYKIKVSSEEESVVRQTADEINEQIASFQKKYKGRDIQDYFALTMIARMTAVKEGGDVSSAEILEEIEMIEKLIG